MNSFLNRLQELTNLSNTEKAIALYLERKYPASLVESISKVSKGAKVSASSVSRFIHRLGYSNFSDLREEANIVIENRLSSPIERYDINKTDNSSKPYGFKEHMDTCVNNITETALRINNEDIQEAASKISSAQNVYIVGGASANALAEYFNIFLRYIRKNVFVISPDISTIAHKLADIKKGDLLVAITHYRTSIITTKVAEFFHNQGNHVVMIADRSINPISPYADTSLIVCSAGAPMFNSRVATIALLESLINMLIPLNEENVKNRFGVMEKIFQEYNVYSK